MSFLKVLLVDPATILADFTFRGRLESKAFKKLATVLLRLNRNIEKKTSKTLRPLSES